MNLIIIRYNLIKIKNPLGEELSYQELSNRSLAHMDEKQFKSKVSEEMLAHNKEIIEKLLNNYCY